MDLALRCSCGAVHGTARDVSPRVGVRLVCLCDDCQAFAHLLEQADTVLHSDGGTELFQFRPARVTLHEGHEHIVCVRLGPKGMLRWYAACCRTPLANTMSTSAIPFASLFRAFMEPPDEALDAAIGPIQARVNGRFGMPPPLPGTYAHAPLALVARSAWNLLRGFVKGEGRPNPFFDVEDAPIVEPRVLSSEERSALHRRTQTDSRPH